MALNIKLSLVSRSYCHLCHEMELALRALLAEDTVALGVELEVLDVDADAQLEARYDQLVPVLLHGTTELCHYTLDVRKVRDYLKQIR